ncbi:MAG: hypothetical protein M3014_08160 [Chloroflexota bacterium]|nr:hypothetical protein [Chloroflexota bacterium]
MEAVIFTGIQASGKSSFYLARFFHTHVRINMDMLRTRHRERLLLRACLEMKQAFVVDNTNPSVESRRLYIEPAKSAGFYITGYYFASGVAEAITRNNLRTGKQRIPPQAIGGTYKRLELPSYTEGYDALYRVMLGEPGQFLVEEW